MSQARKAGIEAIGLVLQPAQVAILQSYFLKDPPAEFSPHGCFSEEFDEIRDLGRRIEWIIQDTPAGFGDAVYQAKSFVGCDPFLVLLGDHLFQGIDETSCIEQILRAFDVRKHSIIGCSWVDLEELERIAAVEIQREMVTQDWIEGTILPVAKVDEKPGFSWSTDRQKFRLSGDRALGAFGMDVFSKDLFPILEDLSLHSDNDGKEIQLRDAQNCLARTSRLSALVMAGNHYDLGKPELYAMNLAVLAGYDPRRSDSWRPYGGELYGKTDS